MQKLSEVVSRIRARLDMTTTEFGKCLGVTHTQISRYELDRAIPGFLALGRLLSIAEGAEKNPIMEHLARLLRKDRGHINETEVMMRLERTPGYFEPTWQSLSSGAREELVDIGSLLDRWRQAGRDKLVQAALRRLEEGLFLCNQDAHLMAEGEPVGNRSMSGRVSDESAVVPESLGQALPNRAALLNLVDRLASLNREVDASLVTLLRLWLDHSDDSKVRERFADAARFLEVAAATPSDDAPPARRSRKTAHAKR